MTLLARWLHVPVAASAFAGILGAGVVDLLLILAGGQASTFDALALALGLYGAVGVIVAVGVGWATATALGAIPGGVRAVRADPEIDLRVATAIFAGTAGALALALALAVAHGAFVGGMNNRLLATIATFGLALALAPVGTLVGLAVRRLARALMARTPRPSRIGKTGLLVLALGAGGLGAASLALSRADWRVLDFGPVKALGIAVALGGAHGIFWYGSDTGRRLHARLPLTAIRLAAVAVTLGLLWPAARLPESSPTWQAVTDQGLGLRLAVGLARRLTDRDGDGFSASFGGGDCDEGRADTYPGAEDVPGDGVDQNCEGGDARVIAQEPSAPAAPPGEAPVRRPGEAWDGNILIVSIDTLRADRLGIAGYTRRGGRSLTPTLDALAREGAYFRRVWAQAPNTPRSFPSLVTSRYPSEIGWAAKTQNFSPLLPSNETFFEHLARAGLRPVGIFSHFYFTAERGLNKAFVEWSNEGAGTIAESNKDIASPRIVPKVIARLEKAAAAGERLVLWTHLFEPHSSYMQHPEFPTTLRGVEGLEEKYDYEIAYVDGWVGKILAALERTGLAQRTAVLVFSDHGEAWGEHKHYFHGQDLTEEQLRVPLILKIPGKAPVVIEDEVALIDVGPTLLDLVGLAAPASFRGRSLLPRIEGKPLPPRPVFGELLPATAWPKHELMMVDAGRKITHKITDRRWELHDLATDPRQQKDLARDPKHAALLEALRAKLLGFEEGRR